MKYNKERRILYRINKYNKHQKPILHAITTEKHVYAKITLGRKVLVECNSHSKEYKGYNMEGAKTIGKLIGKLAKDQNITSVVFNRGQRIYTGRIAAVADGAREYLEF